MKANNSFDGLGASPPLDAVPIQGNALMEARFGDADGAVPALERLLKLPGGRPPVTPVTLRLNPEFDLLRNDPRFQKLSKEKKP